MPDDKDRNSFILRKTWWPVTRLVWGPLILASCSVPRDGSEGVGDSIEIYE